MIGMLHEAHGNHTFVPRLPYLDWLRWTPRDLNTAADDLTKVAVARPCGEHHFGLLSSVSGIVDAKFLRIEFDGSFIDSFRRIGVGWRLLIAFSLDSSDSPAFLLPAPSGPAFRDSVLPKARSFLVILPPVSSIPFLLAVTVLPRLNFVGYVSNCFGGGPYRLAQLRCMLPVLRPGSS